MRRYVRHEPFDIYCFESDEWAHPVHKHTYFEIIFIRDGSGSHLLNDNKWPYKAGDVFFLGPEDYHSFVIDTPTRFCYIRFTESFLQHDSSTKNQHWQHTINTLFTSAYQASGPIVQEDRERKILEGLLEVLLHEYESRHKSSYDMMMDSLMKAILTVVARNVLKQTSVTAQAFQKPQLIEELLVYLRHNIHHPEKLRIKTLAERFYYSPAYLSSFFKKQVGESLQQYITKYKLTLIKYRLQNSDVTISEICDEFGFTDESHLTKVFRKHYNRTPSEFRKQKV
jgi:AraC-like DNA-binding protein